MSSVNAMVGLGLMSCVVLSGTLGASEIAAQPVQDTPKEIIADQIALQGYSCVKPISAERDLQLSKPNEAVWLLKCEKATYRVQLIPDMAAKVERIDTDK